MTSKTFRMILRGILLMFLSAWLTFGLLLLLDFTTGLGNRPEFGFMEWAEVSVLIVFVTYAMKIVRENG